LGLIDLLHGGPGYGGPLLWHTELQPKFQTSPIWMSDQL